VYQEKINGLIEVETDGCPKVFWGEKGKTGGNFLQSNKKSIGEKRKEHFYSEKERLPSKKEIEKKKKGVGKER